MIRENSVYDPSNSSSLETCAVKERVDTLALEISIDDLTRGIVSKIKSVSSRHVNNLPVYDVSTESSAYVANGIIASNCRCAFLPANIGEPTGDQKRTYSSITSAIRRSVAASKKEDTWAGSNLSISRKRPRPPKPPKKRSK